jgi:ABC-type polysaccharide/polyol phosphate export permease
MWTLVVPIATVVIYSTVFSVIFRAQAPPMGNGHSGVFAVWFFVGLVSWNVFSQPMMGGMGSILGMGPMMQKVFIPSYVPVLSAVLTIVIEKALEAAVMLTLLLLFVNIGWTWLLYPLIFLLTGLFAAGLGYCFAVALVYFRDTAQIIGIVMQLWFFLTPVMYPITMIPEDWKGIPLQHLMLLNPMTVFVDMARSVVYDLALPSTGSILMALGWTVAAVGAAVVVYRRWGRDVSEAI